MQEILVGRDGEDLKKHGTSGMFLLGKHYVSMGQSTSLSNPVLMDVARSHVVFVTGKRGSGKCVTGDTLIALDDGRLVPIKELEKDASGVISLNRELKTVRAVKSHFYKRTVRNVLRITMRSGKSIELTPEHPLLSIGGWAKASTFGIGDRIATARSIPNFGAKELPEHHVKLLAYLIAEGHTGKSVLFSNKDEALINDVAAAAKKLDQNLELSKLMEGHYRLYTRNFISRLKESANTPRNNSGQLIKGAASRTKTPIREFIEHYLLYKKLSPEKTVPQEILQLKKPFISIFLRILFSCDGSIYKKKVSHGYCWQISYSTASKEMSAQIQHLLLRYGILSKLRSRKVKCNNKLFDSYELVLDGGNVLTFIEQIGFFGTKQKKVQEALSEIIVVRRNPNVDTIPKGVWGLYRPKSWTEIGREVGYAHPKAMRERVKYAPSRDSLLQIAIADKNEFIYTLATSDIFWDEIVSVENLSGDFEVYDLTVPGMHNFVANDIIIHNSYTMASMAEGMMSLPAEITQNLGAILFDTMGIFWTMKYENKKDADLLREWGLRYRPLNIKVYVPEGKFNEAKEQGLPVDAPFSIRPEELSVNDWCLTFSIPPLGPVGALIGRVITHLKGSFSIHDVIAAIQSDERTDEYTKGAAENLFATAESWGVFSKSGISIAELASPGQIAVLDISSYASSGERAGVRAMVIGLVCQKLFAERMAVRKGEEFKDIRSFTRLVGHEEHIQKKIPLIWVFVDECLPFDSMVNTENGLLPIGDIVNEYENGKKIKVLGYDEGSGQYDYYPVTKVFKIPARPLLKLTTETGGEIKCTANHPLLSKRGFVSADKIEELAIPLVPKYVKRKSAILARLGGHIFGDGYISQKNMTVGFCGKKDTADLERIREDLAELGLKCGAVYSRNTHSQITTATGQILKVVGMSHEMKGSIRVFRYFSELQLPVGDKTLSGFSVPGWVLNGTAEIKAEFLASLMGGDGMAPSESNTTKGDFNPIRLSFNKAVSLEKFGFEYANQIVKLFEDLGVEVSRISKRKGNIRKDGTITFKIVVTLAKNVKNTIAFLEKIGYRYCREKEDKGRKWLAYLQARQFELQKRESLKAYASRLKEGGATTAEIAKKNLLPRYLVRGWGSGNYKKAGIKHFPGFEQWISERIGANVLYEKVYSIDFLSPEPLFDLTVGEVHNFVADGFVVHNCHEFLPREGSTAASEALITLLREGRQPGISLVLASQQPGKIHTDVMTQSDIVIAHHLTAKIDVDALGNLMQSYMREGLDRAIAALPDEKGAAILFDDTNERLYPIRIRPRLSWHGGSSPTILGKEKNSISLLKPV